MGSLLTAGALVLVLLSLSSCHGEDKKADAEKDDNLIVNGSFEEGPDVERWLSLDIGSTAIKGWKVTRDQIDYSGSNWKAADGKRSIDLHGSPGFGGIQQAFKTTKGQRYRVTFAMAGTPWGKFPVNSLCVRAAGKKEVFSFDTTGKSAEDMGWVTKTWEFEATENETTIEFHTLDDEDPNCGPALDNVRVLPVRGNK
jgi:choice-of-anchor C domain-containing protein